MKSVEGDGNHSVGVVNCVPYVRDHFVVCYERRIVTQGPKKKANRYRRTDLHNQSLCGGTGLLFRQKTKSENA